MNEKSVISLNREIRNAANGGQIKVCLISA
jgi:hypothetical protein